MELDSYGLAVSTTIIHRVNEVHSIQPVNQVVHVLASGFDLYFVEPPMVLESQAVCIEKNSKIKIKVRIVSLLKHNATQALALLWNANFDGPSMHVLVTE